MEIFLHCFERSFSVKFREKNKLSYNLSPEQFEIVKTVFEAYGAPFKTELIESECKIDKPTLDDFTPANARVTFKIDEFEFNILNYNNCLIKLWRAEKIEKLLQNKGFEARAEVFGSYHNVNRVQVEIKQPEPVPKTIKKSKETSFKQLSLFEVM